jgi:hypothetical protein
LREHWDRPSHPAPFFSIMLLNACLALLLRLLRYPRTTTHSEIPSNFRAEEYAFYHAKAPHSSGGIEVFLVHEKHEKCCLGGNSELLARLFFVPQNISNVE